ncbi:MAG: flavin reductase family protein [Candidatus Marinimicrobia bacterium]|nr:flavin reductase family protein [Candidatus Neomarinimicrobiota bacterium]MCF7839746.1 flavin reductase family protein [Candidatus Neomarinimicrobiota bacterium]
MILDKMAKNHTLRLLHYNVVIVTAGVGSDTMGATVTFFIQSSFDPPLITMAIKADSRLYTTICEHRYFIANIVERGNRDLATAFFKPQFLTDGTFGRIPAQPHAAGGAIIESAPAWLGCKVINIVEEGDHHLVIGKIDAAGVSDEGAEAMCLSETGWHYGG